MHIAIERLRTRHNGKIPDDVEVEHELSCMEEEGIKGAGDIQLKTINKYLKSYKKQSP